MLLAVAAPVLLLHPMLRMSEYVHLGLMLAFGIGTVVQRRPQGSLSRFTTGQSASLAAQLSS